MLHTTLIEFIGPYSNLVSYRIQSLGSQFQASILWPDETEFLPEVFSSSERALEALLDVDRGIEANRA